MSRSESQSQAWNSRSYLSVGVTRVAEPGCHWCPREVDAVGLGGLAAPFNPDRVCCICTRRGPPLPTEYAFQYAHERAGIHLCTPDTVQLRLGAGQSSPLLGT